MVHLLLATLAILFLPHSRSARDEFSPLAYQSLHPHAHDPLPSYLSTARDIHLHAGVLSVQQHDIVASKQAADELLSPHRRLLSTAEASHASRHAVQLSSGAQFHLRLPHTPPSSMVGPSQQHSVHSFSLHSTTASTSSPSSSTDASHQWLVHIKPPLTSATLSHLASVLAPYHLSAYLPHNTYVLIAPAHVAQRLTGEQDVLFVTELAPEWKYHGELVSHLAARRRQYQLDASGQPTQEEAVWYGNGTHSAGRSHRYHQLRVQLIDEHTAQASQRNSQLCEQWEHYWNRQAEQLAPHQPLSLFTRVRCSVLDSQHLLLELPHLFSELPVGSGSANGTVESLLSFCVRSLSRHPLVHYLSPSHTFTTLNKHARFVTQTDRFLPTSHHYLTPAAALNLSGAGVVIAIGDTGVDFDSCFFHDPAREVPVNRLDAAHRKIITYITVVDPRKGKGERAAPGDSAGHGTHTAGSVAGAVVDPAREGREVRPSVLSELSAYNGMAAGAKLVIHDFLIEGDGNLYVPENVYDDYLTAVVRLGAHISSNSWGDDQGVYDSYSQAVDRFLYLHPHHLMVMAAGNEGTKGLSTIGTPACAKNVLTVGASMNHADSWAELGYNSALEVSEPAAWRGALHVLPADFGTEYMESARHDNVSLVLAEPIEACTALVNAEAVKGKVVVARRGTCKYYEKAKFVEDAGGVLLVVVNNEQGAAVPMTTDAQQPTLTIPAVMISQAEGVHIVDASDELFGQLRLSFPATYDSGAYNERRLSSWSSRGPTQDGRVKPDIVAPGEYIQSAGSSHRLDDYQCGAVHERDKRTVVAMEGTSMATPVAAGNAAMLRQFFVEGKYRPPQPAQPNPYDGPPGVAFDPTSSLLKAMLAHGTVAVGGTVHESKNGQREVRVLPPPSIYQGHGRIQLDQVLNFPVQRDDGSVGVPFQLFVDDNSTLRSMQHAVYCLRVTDASAPLKATLAWIDPPGALHTSLALINQFDLLVTRVAADGAEGRVWAGNDHSEADHTPMQWDTANNLEKVTVEQPAPGLYQVVVRASMLPSGQPERYSLVVTGQYAMEAEAACPVDVYCPNHCSGRGRCNTASCQAGRGAGSTANAATANRSTADERADNNGVCECDPHYAGADCSIDTTELLLTTPPLSIPIQPNSWSYFFYEATPHTVAFNFTFTRVSPFGDPDFYLSHPHNRSYPTLAHWWRKDTVYDPAMKPQPPVHVFEVRRDRGEVVSGTYMVGVWGYCCEVPTVTVELHVELSDAVEPTAEAGRLPWPTEEGCAPRAATGAGVALTASAVVEAAPTAAHAGSGTADGVLTAEAAMAQPAAVKPSLPVAVLVAFQLTFPEASHPSLPTASPMIAEEWKSLFRQAHPLTPVPSVQVMALTATTQAPAPPAPPPLLPPPSSSEHREATMSSQQRTVYNAQLLLLGNATATDEQSRQAAVSALMEQVRRLHASVGQTSLTSSLLASLDASGPLAQCDVSKTYTNRPYQIACDDSSLQAAINNPAPVSTPMASAPPAAPSDVAVSSPVMSGAVVADNAQTSSMSTEVQIALLVASVLFLATVFGVCFRGGSDKEVGEADRLSRQRPLPLVRHAVDEQQQMGDEINTPASSTSSSSSSLSSHSASSAEPSDTRSLPSAPSSFFSFGWWFGGQADKVRFSALEQQDRDEREAEEDSERMERAVGGAVLAAEAEGASESSSDLEVAVTYR